MLYSITILDRVHELQVLVNRLCDLKVVLPEPFQVGTIILKLSSTWNGYRKKLLHMQEDFTVEKIMRHLPIEEETRESDASHFLNSSNVKYVNEKPKKNNKMKAPDRSNNNKNKNDKKNNRKCYGCNKKGHYIKDCNLVKKLKRDASQAKVNLVENENQEFVATVTDLKDLQIGMATEVHRATTKSVGWWMDSGASVHICNDRAQFKSYVEAVDKEVLMGNHSVAKVLGQRMVELQFTLGKKLTLENILHVPKIRKIFHLLLLCKGGFKAVMKSDLVVLSNNGIFVAKGYYNDGIFKLNFDGINERMMLLFTLQIFVLYGMLDWHI